MDPTQTEGICALDLKPRDSQIFRTYKRQKVICPVWSCCEKLFLLAFDQSRAQFCFLQTVMGWNERQNEHCMDYLYQALCSEEDGEQLPVVNLLIGQPLIKIHGFLFMVSHLLSSKWGCASMPLCWFNMHTYTWLTMQYKNHTVICSDLMYLLLEPPLCHSVLTMVFVRQICIYCVSVVASPAATQLVWCR